MPSLITGAQQQLSPGRLVELFDFDVSKLGGGVYRFCSSFKETGDLTWRGMTYAPLPVIAEGFEVSGKGQLPKPTLKLSNVALVGSALISEFGDPLGAKVTRWLTFSEFLDGGAYADENQHFIPQIFVVERKKTQNAVMVEFELSASIDQEGRMLPGRQIVRNYCGHRYRRWDAATGQFDYVDATCPYAGSDSVEGGAGPETPYFDATGTPVAENQPEKDTCGKKLSDCKLRFGRNAELPFRGFPGVGRIRRT